MTQESFFAPGKRAIFIKPMNGYNMGKIVELRHPFEEMNRAPIGSWVPIDHLYWYKGDDATNVWIVESMGDPLVYIKNGEIAHQMIGPVPERYLAPLDDFDSNEDLWIASAAPKQKQETVSHENHATEPTN